MRYIYIRKIGSRSTGPNLKGTSCQQGFAMRAAVLLILAVTLCCTGGQQALRGNAVPLAQGLTLASDPAPDIMAMMDTTVQIQVTLETTVIMGLVSGGTPRKVKDGWTGSGVVYAKGEGVSLILSANHVLQVPEVGAIEPVTFLGVEIGLRQIDAVEIVVKTTSGLTCKLEPLVLGVDDHRDVATGVADCDAGRVAKIAMAVPVKGERVQVSGHPQGIPLPMVTEGYLSGVYNRYLLISAGAWGGNSGGPVFYRGQVIGLLVRGSRTYHNISLAAPLEEIHRRISETQEYLED
jgi:S1-C subfamily serine protease